MNILLVCNKFPFPPRDGGSLASYNMAKGLMETGNQVDLLAMNTSKHFSRHGTSDIDIKGMGRVRSVNIDNSISYSGVFYNLLFSSIPYNARQFINRRFSEVLAEMLREKSYDIIQLEGLYLWPYVKTIRENTRAKIAYRAHNVEHVIWDTYNKRRKSSYKKWYIGKMQKRIRNYEQEFINSYDLLATVTAIDLEILNSMGNEKPSLVAPFGMWPDEYPENNKSDNGCFLLQYIGALDWLPNIESLNWFIERVWTVAKEKYPEIRFCVAGSNAKKSYVNYLINNGIDFMGEIDDSREYLSQNSIFVAPLFSGSGIRVKVIEAMFMGKPILATSYAVSGIPVENGKQILMARDEHNFIECIDKLLADPDYANRLGVNAREFSHQYFDNSAIAEELAAFYKKNLI